MAGRIPWEQRGSGQSQQATEARLVGYMAQHDLLAESPSLSADAPGLPHTKAGPRGDREQWRSNVWIGPRGTFTPIHRDPYENLFVQVVGSKRVHLFPPSASSHLYLGASTGAGTQKNTSAIPTEDPLISGSELLHQYPDISKAIQTEGSASAQLDPGDVLYIPRGWFHCVQSLSTSASVNWWFL